MERVLLRELGFKSRNEALTFLRRLWRQEKVACLICGNEFELLHKKANKSDCDWQCKNCNKTYKTMYLLDEINEQMQEY